jgi:DnaJ-class molecular chaperone
MLYGAFIIAPRPSSKKKTSTSRPEKPRFNFRSCAWCQGTGVEGKGKSKKQCSVCDGQKRVLVEAPYSECPKCKGKGHISMNRRCKVCHGAGWNTYAYIE